MEQAKRAGELLAERAKRGRGRDLRLRPRRLPYHGRVKALAEGAREGGLKF